MNGKVFGLTSMVENQISNFDYAIKNGQALEVLDPKNLQLNVVNLESLLFDSSISKSIYNGIYERYEFHGARRVSELILKKF